MRSAAEERTARTHCNSGPISPASLAPTIEQLGVASVGDLDAEALLDQMRSGTQANESLVVAQFQFGAWSRV